MTIFFWILFVLLLLFFGFRFLTNRLYELKLTPHEETPEKFNIQFEEVRFPTRNQRSLYGWWIPAESLPESAPTLILVHGWSRNLGRMLRYIQHLHPMNYNLLAFDARHHGSSDRDGHSSMYKFGQDIQAAVEYACSREVDSDKIGVIGLSIGGAGSVYAAALDSCIKAVVTVGAPAHPVDVMKRQFKQYRLPTVFAWVLLKQIQHTIGISYEEFAPVVNIAKSNASFLIIHGDDDQVVLPSQGEKLCAAAKEGQSDCWSIPEFGHSNCHHHADFWPRVDQFFQNKLSDSSDKNS